MKSQRASTRAVIGASALALFVVYAAICVSPLKTALGRQHPGIASLLAPPAFNFGATYTDGEVLDFRVGMSRLQLAEMLEKRYATRSVLGGYCADPLATQKSPAEVRIDGSDAYRTLIGRNSICLSILDSRVGMTFALDADVVNRIDIWRVRNEML